MWLGKRHTIVDTQRGPMLQIDRAATVMLAPLKLVDFCAKMAKMTAERLRLEDLTRIHQKLRESALVWKIKACHTPREYKLRGFDTKPVSQSMFEKSGDDGQVRTLSVLEYFNETYPHVKITRPDLPCVLVGPKSEPDRLRVPMEICAFVSCQPAPMTPEIQQEQIKETAAVPRVRFADIEKIQRDLLKDHEGADQTAPAFSIAMGNNLVTANAVVLASPKLAYRDSNGHIAEATINTQKGEWNLRNPRGGDLAFMTSGSLASGNGFAVVKFERTDDRNIATFLQNMQKFAGFRGVRLGQQVGRILDGSHLKYGDEVEKFLDRIPEKTRVGLVVCILSDKSTMNAREIYPAIKRWSHTKAMIPTQCVQVGKAMGKLMTSPQYHAGVLLKINLKLGGANLHAPANHGGLALLRQEPTMVMGFDINHPQPGSRKPSYAALVATMDVECSKYFTVVGAQKSRTEVSTDSSSLIVDFVDKVRSCLRQFKMANGVAPQRIIFYRDGVAHNQFDSVKETEIGQIFDACRKEGGNAYVPTLTFIIVQQRTRARFATEHKEQVTAGTVINQDVVGADGKDWYMVSQHGLKGTARPSHYHVIRDDAETNVQLLQRLTFELCHLYARATKIVSRPAPVYYAHRAAFLAQYYKDNYKEDNMMEMGSHASFNSANSAESIPDITLGPTVASTVYFA